jgi:hypothetical protein
MLFKIINERIMKLLALLTINMIMLPILTVIRVQVFKNNAAILEFLSGLVFVAMGYLAGAFIKKNDEYAFIRTPISYACVLIPLSIAVIIHVGYGWLGVILELSVATVFYFIGLRGYFKEYDEIISSDQMMAGAILLSSSIVCSYYIKNLMQYKILFFILAYLCMAVLMILTNQSNIKRFIKKDAANSDAATSIKRQNFILVAVIFVSVLILSNLKGIVLSLIGILGEIFKIVTGFIFYLLSFKPDKEYVEPSIKKKIVKQAISGKDPIKNFIINIIIYFIILFLIYKLAPIIARMIIKAFNNFKNLLKFVPEKKADISDEYTDEIQKIEHLKSNLNEKKGKQALKKLRKDLAGAATSLEKIRFMYKIIIQLLSQKDIEITKSDTTGEIYKKSIKIAGIEAGFLNVTNVYNKVRYDESIPDPTVLPEVEADYKEITNILKSN